MPLSPPGQQLGAMVTCLTQARRLGLLQSAGVSEDSELWNGMVPLHLLKQAMCHGEDQVRLDAFGLLCDNLRVTEPISNLDLQLLRFFLPHNLTSQSAAFRQHLVSLAKKLFIRLRDSRKSLERNVKQSTVEGRADYQGHLQAYHSFQCWLLRLLFSQVHPGAAFPSRSTALALLAIYAQIEVDISGLLSLSCPLVSEMSTDRVQSLLESLTDTFEQNKTETFTVLTAVPPERLPLGGTNLVSDLIAMAMGLAGSTRPQDCTTAAYLLRLLLRLPGVVNELTSHHRDVDPDTGCLHGYLILRLLLELLQRQVAVSRTSLLHAAATGPLYPVLHCVRYLLGDLNLR